MTTATVVTSTRNRRVADAARLRRSRERRATGRYLVEGPRALEAYLGGDQLVRVFAVPDVAERLAVDDVDLVVVAPHVLERLADSRTPQGVVGVARRRAADLDAVVGRGLLVVLDGVADPGNAGSVIRSAEAFGARGVVLTPGSVDPWNPKAVRAAAGALARAAVVADVTLEDVATRCRQAGQPLYGLAADGSARLDVLRADGPVALVLGGEAHGLSADAARLLDALVAIEMPGGAESLNLAAAAAIALHAAARP